MIDPKLVQQEIREAPSDEARLALLLDRSMAAYRSHPNEARKWAEEARKLAKKLKRPVDEARAIYRIGCAKLQTAVYPDARVHLNEAAERFRQTEEGAKYVDAPIFMLGQIEQMTGNLSHARAAFEEVLVLRHQYEKNNVWEVLIALGIVALQQADYATALKHFFLALEDGERTENKLVRAIALSNIGAVYLAVSDNAKASEYLEKALILERNIEDRPGTVTILGNLATNAIESGAFGEAERYAKEALNFRRFPECRSIAAFAPAVLAGLEVKRGNLVEAATHFEESIQEATSLGLYQIVAEAQVGLAEVYVLMGTMPEGTIDRLEEALQFSREHGQLPIECRALSVLARTHQQEGHLEIALSYYQAFVDRNGYLNNQERQRAVVEVQARVEIERLERERSRMEEIARSANERAALLAQASERQSNELTALALQLVQKNEFLTDLREKIEHQGGSRTAANLVSEIDDHVRSDRDWEVFENQLNQVHADFLKKLSSLYPSLTPMELKTAALMKLNLTSKAIASLFCLSVRTVENHRLNIRRKLALGPDDNLVSFLSGL